MPHYEPVGRHRARAPSQRAVPSPPTSDRVTIPRQPEYEAHRTRSTGASLRSGDYRDRIPLRDWRRRHAVAPCICGPSARAARSARWLRRIPTQLALRAVQPALRSYTVHGRRRVPPRRMAPPHRPRSVQVSACNSTLLFVVALQHLTGVVSNKDGERACVGEGGPCSLADSGAERGDDFTHIERRAIGQAVNERRVPRLQPLQSPPLHCHMPTQFPAGGAHPCGHALIVHLERLLGHLHQAHTKWVGEHRAIGSISAGRNCGRRARLAGKRDNEDGVRATRSPRISQCAHLLDSSCTAVHSHLRKGRVLCGDIECRTQCCLLSCCEGGKWRHISRHAKLPRRHINRCAEVPGPGRHRARHPHKCLLSGVKRQDGHVSCAKQLGCLGRIQRHQARCIALPIHVWRQPKRCLAH
mmetsp:Transcript_26200/g.73371  ORF Transcript_26200/g.73371 Transcript_26200/m.73371 type:complete len:413 (-) Transcript_26200:230-1468(-)